MLREEVELPRQLLDVERDAVGQVLGRRELLAALLQRRDQRDRLAVERRVLRRARGAQVRLQRDVAEILQREHAEVVGVPQHLGNRHRHLRHQRRDVHERQLRDVERRGVQRQHDRRRAGQQDAEVAAVRRVAASAGRRAGCRAASPLRSRYPWMRSRASSSVAVACSILELRYSSCRSRRVVTRHAVPREH